MAKNTSKIHHVFLINLIFLYGKNLYGTDWCVWVKYSRAPLPLLHASLCISFVCAICVPEVQALPMYPSEPSLRPGSCQWSRKLPSDWCILLVLLSHPSRRFPKAPTVWLACPYCHEWILRIKNQSLKNHVGFFSWVLIWGFHSIN